jgi:hypothetical protein
MSSYRSSIGCVKPLTRVSTLVAAAMLGWVLCWPLSASAQQVADSAAKVSGSPRHSPAESQAEYLGRASCAASTCHGGVIDRGPSWRHALSRWVAEDPHAGAGLVLLGRLSETIVFSLDRSIADLKRQQANLKPTEQTWTRKRDALLRDRCISCHMTATAQQCQSGEPLSSTALAEGVSCESCHGAAESWYSVHVQNDFAGPSRFESGLRDTESIIGRASGCVRCHVGSRTDDGLVRDMNHDLIAAGHPVLRFDLSLYDAALPRHWDVESSAAFYQSSVRVRRAGRATSLAAAARLAGSRADGYLAEQESGVDWGERIVPMPELSDYDCFACHQSLSMDQYRLPVGSAASELVISAGLPIWNAWHTIALLELEVDQLQVLAPHQFDSESGRRLSRIGAAIADMYDRRAEELATSDFDPISEIRDARGRLGEHDDWHQAAINYLDIEAALRQLAQEDEKYRPLHGQFVAQAQVYLQFDRGAQSPEKFDIDASIQFSQKVKQLLEPIPE